MKTLFVFAAVLAAVTLLPSATVARPDYIPQQAPQLQQQQRRFPQQAPELQERQSTRCVGPCTGAGGEAGMLRKECMEWETDVGGASADDSCHCCYYDRVPFPTTTTAP
ncbi:uncharacterized protein LOC108664907 [Hyalella azteca]|uniref:Uncharacterized protein LOC108664907 n=1 Tax=Hyalella azteca TaxID=294128 RepID=A0A8B7N0R4_HYAAZ|nr:uncharacterized protein LOC108664907 [Hyalella azteca]